MRERNNKKERVSQPLERPAQRETERESNLAGLLLLRAAFPLPKGRPSKASERIWPCGCGAAFTLLAVRGSSIVHCALWLLSGCFVAAL